MTYEEIKEIRANKTFISKEGAEYSQMIDAAIEKQIPKKVVVEESECETLDMETGEWFPDIREDWICPVCGEYAIPYDYKYCCNCGQKLDWSEIRVGRRCGK